MLKNVSPELIENVKDLKIALNELTVYDLNVYSMSELYYKVAHKLNEVINELSRFEGVLSDEVIKQNEKLIYLLGEGLEIEVVKEIDNLIKKGFFEEIINEKIFSDLNNKIDTFKSDLNNKVDTFKSEIDSQLAHIENETEGIISVKKFGAKGDGVTDDTHAFQNAIDYAINNNSKTIYVPSGNYLITSSLEINGDPNCWDLTIKGSGKGIDGRGSCIKYTGVGNLLNIDLNYNVGGWRGITFSNLAFKGINSNNCISLVFTQQTKFDNVYFDSFKSAVVLTGDSHYPYFTNCNFSNSNIGIHILDENETGFVVGNSNNGKIDNCFFTFCKNPFLQGDGSEWLIINTDFEGSNGSIILNSSNRMINCRIERNNQDENWLLIRGDNNQIDVNMHGIGSLGGKVEYRMLVKGNNNIIKGCYGYLIYAINDEGLNNRFYINTDNSKYSAPTTYVLKPGSFVFNNHNTMLNKNRINLVGENGVNHGDFVTHSTYKTKHRLVKRVSESYCRYTYAVDNLYTEDKIWFEGCDLYVKDNHDGFVINVMGSEITLTNKNQWVSVINVTYKESIPSTSIVAKTNTHKGDYYFTVANPFVSEIHPPVNYIRFSNSSNITNQNFVNNTLYIDEPIENVLKFEELGQLNINFKNKIFKYTDFLCDSEGNHVVFTDKLEYAIPGYAHYVLVEGKGKGKYINCILSRDNRSQNFTVVDKKNYGCDITNANTEGTIIGTNLNSLEFFITVLL